MTLVAWIKARSNNVRFSTNSKNQTKNHDLSTVTENGCENQPESFGSFVHIRDNLDYSYHLSYPEERQWLQDSIIETILGKIDCQETTPLEPWLIYLMGSFCTGRDKVLQKLQDDGNLPLLSYVYIHTDDILKHLPESSFTRQFLSDESESRVRREAKLISEITEQAAMEAGKNIIINCSPLDKTWYFDHVSMVREKFPNYKVAIFHVTSSLSHALHVNSLRAKKHKSVSPRLIEKMSKEIPKVAKHLQPLVHYSCEIVNEDQIKLLPDDDWDLFQVNWLQTPKHNSNCTSRKDQRRASMAASVKAIKAAPPQRMISRIFSAKISTEENHMNDDKSDFYGPYAKIRATLDYNFHCNYTKQRQILQDRIISSFLGNILIQDKNGNLCTTPTEPFIVFTAGAMGAGKGHTIRTLVDRGHFPLLAFVVVDPDEIRRHFPEYEIYIEHCPERAGELTRKEAGFVAEILTSVALEQGKNVLVDGSLRDSDWYQIYFQQLRDNYSQLKLSIIHVTAPRETIFRRAEERGMATGRVVPIETMIMAMEQVPRSVQILKKLVDVFVEIDNPDDSDIQITNNDMDWTKFTSLWLQTCAYVPNRNLKKSAISTRF